MSDTVAFYQKSTQELEENFGTNVQQGLSEKDAQERLEKYGNNQLDVAEKESIGKMLWNQINNPVIYLLTTATVVSFSFGDITEGVAIIVVIVLNTIIGFWMEYQAQQSMTALKNMDEVKARVLRNGNAQKIPASELVPGDVLIVEAGGMVGADARLIECNGLSVDESALTGESLPVPKTADIIDVEVALADRKNMLYKGTALTQGNGRAIVVATGMATEIGRITEMVSHAEADEIPINTKLKHLTRRLIWLTLGLALLFCIVGYFSGIELYQLVQTSIAWTVAAIPEGLPIVASIALARGMLKLAKQQVVVKRLGAVETLGETTVIFTDKTGTLTYNQLTVSELVFDGDELLIEELEQGKKEKSEEALLAAKVLTLCNNASLEGEHSGDPLEVASLLFAQSLDKSKYEALRKLERLEEKPFVSESMIMGTLYASASHDTFFVAVKGATEKVLSRCTRIVTKEGVMPLEETTVWKEKDNAMADKGLRVLALAFKELSDVPKEDEWMEGLTLIGLVAYQDPPRKEVSESIQLCQRAGVQVVMVTGDHPATATTIGEKVGVVQNKNKKPALSGPDLEDSSSQSILERSVFARVDPGQKLEIIKAYQENGEIVAMTGDGVNDAPALKKADIGIAMGKKGTQVAQEAADMVLKDDAFDSIVAAIKQGRIIFDNIRKFIVYQLSYHLAEILVIAAVSFGLHQLALLPLQLLFLNLLSDVFPALALGIGPGGKEVMTKPPKSKREPLIPNALWLTTGLYGLIIGASIVGVYFYAHLQLSFSTQESNNIAFFALAIAQLLHVFNMRDRKDPVFFNQVTQNKYIWMALLFCFSVLAAAYFIPYLRDVLSFQPMSSVAWLLVAIGSITPLVIIQFTKLFR